MDPSGGEEADGALAVGDAHGTRSRRAAAAARAASRLAPAAIASTAAASTRRPCPRPSSVRRLRDRSEDESLRRARPVAAAVSSAAATSVLRDVGRDEWCGFEIGERDRGDFQALERAVAADEIGDEIGGRLAEDVARGCRTARGTPPTLSSAMRSPIFTASSMSCVTKTTVLRSSACRRRNSSWSRVARDRVDGAERLVHQQHGWVGRERARHADALALTAGELRPGSGRGTRGFEPDESRAARRRARRCARWSQPSSRGTVATLSRDRLVGEQPDLLDHVADAPAQLHRIDAR